MQCEIINIGDELLIGQTVNTNAAWLGQELSGIGMEVRQSVVVRDDKEAIVEAVRRSMAHAQWVFVTGGLGPTRDDITKEAFLSMFGGKLVFHEETWDQLGKIYRMFGRQLTESHRSQCELPSKAQVLSNRMGTAPGLLFKESHCNIVVMPGVPYEMEYIMQTHVIPMIITADSRRTISYQTIATVGEAESVIASKIEDIEDNLPAQIKIAYLPTPGRVRIRVTGYAPDVRKVIKQVGDVASQIAERISDVVYAMEDISLGEAIGRTLRDRGSSLSVAESCTGGYLGHLITSIPNSSEYFVGGAITYSNALKQSVLGVKAATLDQFGAVSEETVQEMALGALKTFGSDYALAVSGVAGPGGGSKEKPVGTVWIALASGETVVARKFTFGKDRLRNIELSAVNALNMLRKSMKEDQYNQ